MKYQVIEVIGKFITQIISGTPSGPTAGQIWFDSTANKFKGQKTATIVDLESGIPIDLASQVTGLLPFANITNMANGTIMYRKTTGTGAMETQTLSTLKTDLGITGGGNSYSWFIS